MSYSCVDFTDSILNGLNIIVPEEHWDNPEGQAELALAEIKRLQDLEASRKLADQNGGTWGEHHTYKPADWRLEVEARDTRSGYWDWVQAKIEAEGT
jgi:hypothetical protein